jgi:hypothetical protein
MNSSPAALDFSGYIADRTRDFTGREWVFKTIDDWLADPYAPQAFLLAGNPGSGKTAIAARLVQFSTGMASPPETLDRLTPGFLSGVHFCSARDRRWINPHTFTESLALQLAARYPAFAQALAERSGDRQIRIEVRQRAGSVSGEMAGVVIHKLEVGALPAEDAFGKTVREPLEALLRQTPSERLVILVDALDEALLYTGATGIVDLLADMKHLPKGVRWILTSRREEAVENRFLDAVGLFLSAGKHAQAGQEDVRRYVVDRLDKDKRLAEQAAALTEEQHNATVAAIVDGTESNFLYATFVLEEMAQGQRALSDAGGLPQGLDGLYYDSLARIINPQGTNWTTNHAPLLGLLSVGQGSLTSGQLAAFTGLSEAVVWEGLGRLQQFVQEEAAVGADATGEPAYRLYHQSVVDFLRRQYLVRNSRQLRNGYYLPAEPWHRQIADHYWQAHRPDWRCCDAYGLDSLATHLHLGGQGDRLQELISQPWMAARFEGSNYTYDGFLADLMLAWQGAHGETQRQIEADEAPAALADCVRYALIRTSINSLSANYVPALVARAVETGLWPAERALSVAGLVPDPRIRAHMLVVLLARVHLKAEQIDQARKSGLEAALAIGFEQARVGALAALAPQLTGEARVQALARGLEAALAIRKEEYRADALAALAPQLTGELLVRGLEAALVIGNEEDRASVLAALAPQLAGEARAQALARGLEAALAIEHVPYRAEALAALAPQLTGEARVQTLARGLEAALAIGNEPARAKALAALAPQLTGELLARGLEAALAIGDEWARVWALAALAPQLTGETRVQALARGLEAALAIWYGWAQAEALAALAPQLTGEARVQALARGLEAVLAIGEEEYRAAALAALAPQLTGEARVQALARGLEAALAIEHEPARAKALAALAPQLTGEARVQALEQGLEAALAIGEKVIWRAMAPQFMGESRVQALARRREAALFSGFDRARVRALAALAPQLTGELLAQALAAPPVIGDERARAEVLAALALQLTGEARVQALAQGLEAALAIGDELPRADALAALAPHLPGELLARAIRKEGARAEVLAALALQLTGEARVQALAQGLEAALTIGNEWARARALAALAPQLTGELLARGLEAALAIGNELARAKALAALAPQLTGELLARGLEAALAIVGDDLAREWALAALAPQLAGELLAQGLEAALAIEWEVARVGALAALAPQLTGEARVQALARGLEAALAIEDEYWRAEALAALAPQLTGEARVQALARGLEAALAIGDEWFRARALATLAPQLTGEARVQALARGLEAALAIEDEYWRAEALAAFLATAPDPAAALRNVRQAMADHLLKNLPTTKREEMLRFCAEEKLFTPPIFDQDTLAAIAGHIVEVCQEWRWM